MSLCFIRWVVRIETGKGLGKDREHMWAWKPLERNLLPDISKRLQERSTRYLPF